MRSLSKHLKYHFFRRSQTGQAIILLAIAMIGLLAFVGLVTDISLLFVRFSQLRRAVDAASIAAAGQIRENREYADIALAARQFIRLHGLDPDRVLVETCVTNPGDAELCTTPPRKLVRVQAQIDSPMTFLRLLGWQTVTLETSAVSETAALDVALVLDTSELMAEYTTLGDYTSVKPGYTPRAGCGLNVDGSTNYNYYECCNDPGDGVISLNGVITNLNTNVANTDYSDLVCQPFKQVKDAAREFVQRLDFVRGDRVVFVTFDRAGAAILPDNPSGPGTLPPLITDEAIAVDTLNEKVGVGMNHERDSGQSGRCYTFAEGLPPFTYDWLAPCPDTNIGGGLVAAQQVLTSPEYIRRTAVWVIILLSDGAASATDHPIHNSAGNGVLEGDYGYWGYCPWWTFCDPVNFPNAECTAVDETGTQADTFCSDVDPLSRHFCMTATGDIAYDAPGCNIERLRRDRLRHGHGGLRRSDPGSQWRGRQLHRHVYHRLQRPRIADLAAG